jgi:hypothetical protein
MSSELNPEIQEWMSSVAVRHLNEYINNNNTEQSPNTQSYIVRAGSEPVVGAVAPTAPVADSTAGGAASDAENVEFLDARSEFDDTVRHMNGGQQRDPSYNDMPSVVIGSEAWHASVPTDWVNNSDLLCVLSV